MREIEYFLQILADHLAGRKSQPPKEALNLETLLTLARNHNLDGIFYTQCKSFLPPQAITHLSSISGNTLFIYYNRQNQLAEIDKHFREANIPYFLVKGVKVSKFYPIPALRTMGDADMIVSPEEREKAGQILESLGFVRNPEIDEAEWEYEKKGLSYELHDALVYTDTTTDSVIADFLKNYEKHIKGGDLDENFHFVYLLCHLRKHLMNSGIGFRHFYDLAVLIQKDASLNFEAIQQMLVSIGLLDFAKICFAFTERWFLVKSPFGSLPLEEDFYTYATEQIAKNGVFGFQNEENKDNIAVNQARQHHGSRLHRFCTLVFPGYESLIQNPKYAFLKGKKILLPAAWIFRWFSGFGKRKSVKITPMASKSVAEKRNAYLKKWNLI